MNETKCAIQSAFIMLYRRQPVNQISVKGLCAQVPIARTTFYEYYSNLAELKCEIEDQMIDGLFEIAATISKGDFMQMDLAVFFEQIFEYIKAHWEVNYAFLVCQPNLSYIEKWKKAIKCHFTLRFPEKRSIPNYGLIQEVIASSVIGAYTYWMEHPEEVESEKLVKISVQMLSAAEQIL